MAKTDYGIVADVPTSAPGLGFREYAAALAEAIQAGDPPQFTIGIYGKWGSGKSSLLKATKESINSTDKDNVIVVEFDAWRYQRSQEIVIPLVHAILGAVRETQDASLIKSVAGLVRAIGMNLSFRLPIVGKDLSISQVKETWDEQGDLEITLDDVFARPFYELQRVGQELGERRIAILIDDLDRCTPDNIISVLESINVITDVPGFVFILALDYDVIVSAINERYPGVNGHEFVDKIIQLPFRIPRLDASIRMLDNIIPNYDKMEHLKPVAEDISTIVNLAFDANPRSAKRFINALTLIVRILNSRGVQSDLRLVAAVLAGELRWPEEFHDLRSTIRESKKDPFGNIRRSDDERLTAFVSLFLSADITDDALDPILRLTATVTAGSDSEDPQDERQSTRSISYNPALLAGLTALGFREYPHNNVYVYPGVRTIRFRITGDVVVHESRDSADADQHLDTWQKFQSFDLSHGVDSVLSAARKVATNNASNLLVKSRASRPLPAIGWSALLAGLEDLGFKPYPNERSYVYPGLTTRRFYVAQELILQRRNESDAEKHRDKWTTLKSFSSETGVDAALDAAVEIVVKAASDPGVRERSELQYLSKAGRKFRR